MARPAAEARPATLAGAMVPGLGARSQAEPAAGTVETGGGFRPSARFDTLT
jgi:hypothetical protein